METKHTHTPGPWSINGDTRRMIGGNDGKMMLAETLFDHINPKWRRTLAEAQANARLIAAAPELLATIHGLLDAVSDLSDPARSEFNDYWVMRAAEVVSKATGQEEAPAARTAADDARDYPNDPPGYAARVRELEAQGMTTSDAQGGADIEFGLL